MQWDLAEVLDLFSWGLEVFSRRDCGLILAGIRQCKSDRQTQRLLTQLEQRQWIKRCGEGRKARFAMTAAGAEQVKSLDPGQQWNAVWDGKWRLFTYDLPEKRRAERVILWRALRARKFGFLQRSVWVWPHPVESMLESIVQATGVPECFCSFVCEQLFLCTSGELVSTSWDFQKVRQCHQQYLNESPRFFESLQKAADLEQVARIAAVERSAFGRAFSPDPLLPRGLWPEEYQGDAVARRHGQFRTELLSRIEGLAEV